MTKVEKVVIVGATSAIAQAVARLFAKDMCSFVLLGRKLERLEKVASDLKVRGAKQVDLIQCEVANSTEISSCINPNLNLLKDVDLFLLAYGSLGNQIEDQNNAQKIAKELEVNFTSVAIWLSFFADICEKNNSGTIAVLSSVAGDRGRKKNYIYGAAKAGISTLVSGLRNRLALKNVHVLNVKPGFVDTPMTKDFKKGLLFAKPERVAKDIYNAIYSRSDEIYTPWYWRYIMLIIKNIPESIFKRLNI